MKIFYCALLIAAFMLPTSSSAYDDRDRHYDYDGYDDWSHQRDDDRYNRHRPFERREREERYHYSDDRNRRDSHREDKHRERRAPAGWDVNPDIAKHSYNCHHYHLSVTGGKATARITPLPGKNYIQTHDQRTGYVCFEDSARLELGKLANPQTEVTLRLRDIGTFVFTRGDKGSKYKNNWYRTYWGLQ